MPIEIIPNPNGGYLGSGLPLRWNWLEAPEGPFDWRIILRGEGVSPPIWIEATRPRQGTQTGDTWRPFITGTSWRTTTNVTVPLTQGSNVNGAIEAIVGGVVTASIPVTGTWDATSGIPILLQENTTGGSGGFTANDRALLTTVEARSTLLGEPGSLTATNASGPLPITLSQIFSRNTLDLLTMAELTNGETFDPVRVDVSFTWYRAIVVRVTTIAEDLVPKTPDQSWYFPDLAVLRLFRGVDLEFRRGIHTPTFIQEKQWGWGWTFPNFDAILGAPPETTVAVDWRIGCGGQVFALYLP